MEEISEVLDVAASDQSNVFGQFDSHIKKLEKELFVSIVDRNGKVRISGKPAGVKRARAVIHELTELSRRGNIIQEQDVDYAITRPSPVIFSVSLPRSWLCGRIKIQIQSC